MKYGNIFWGLILLTIGVLFALRNFDVIDFRTVSLLRLWPFILVFIGISILPVKPLVKILLSAGTIILAIVFILAFPAPSGHWFRFHLNGNERHTMDVRKQVIVESFDSGIQVVHLNLDFAAGDYKISGTTRELFNFTSEGNLGDYKTSSTQDDSLKSVNISLNDNHIEDLDIKNDVTMSLNPGANWEIELDAGAANLDFDLSPYKVSNLNIEGGAASMNIIMGSLQKKANIDIDAGASSINIKVPEASACEINAETVLSDRDFKGFDKISKGLYRTPGFSDTMNQVYISVDAGVSQITVERIK